MCRKSIAQTVTLGSKNDWRNSGKQIDCRKSIAQNGQFSYEENNGKS